MARSQLDHVLLGDQPGDSPWSRATGRVYDVRVASYGESGYAVSVNRDRVGRGTTGWVCLRDRSFGQVAGLCIFTDGVEAADSDGIAYAPGIIWPLPREYWIDGARIQLDQGWSQGAPFKAAPNRFTNGTSLKAKDAELLLALLAPPVRIWRDAIRDSLTNAE